MVDVDAAPPPAELVPEEQPPAVESASAEQDEPADGVVDLKRKLEEVEPGTQANGTTEDAKRPRVDGDPGRAGVEKQNDDSSVEVAAEASKVAPTDVANRPDVDAQAAQTASLAEPRMCLCQDAKKGKKTKEMSKTKLKILQKRKEEKRKKLLQAQSIEILQKHKIPDDAYLLLHASGTIGQAETVKQKRRHAVQLSRAGFDIPEELSLFKISGNQKVSGNSVVAKQVCPAKFVELAKCKHHDMGYKNNSMTDSAKYQPVRDAVVSMPVSKTGEPCDDALVSTPKIHSFTPSCSGDLQGKEILQGKAAVHEFVNPPIVVPVSRPPDVEKSRSNLPIIMMEQEIMEAIFENSIVILCGETGCGKTTQVPQFLYEAGFGTSDRADRKGKIGITQPRRVSVLATAARVSYELGLKLGKEVGFQVRHDKQLGSKCKIKFMTDGILLREIQSRGYQVKMDLLRASGDSLSSSFVEEKLWTAIASETASAIKYGSKETSSHSISSNGNLHLRKAFVELPVRVDFVGGWSDTPPWSLERPGCVLNMAISLNGRLPVGAMMETTDGHLGVLIEDDASRSVYIDDPASISSPFEQNDPFRLVKSALFVTGALNHKILSKSGLNIKTWANVPRGSGLGTSSILAAAVVKGLFQLMEDDESDDNVARAVLVVEQIMGTGGGWQDQIGGLYPGIKCTQSFPGQPLRLQVVPLLASPHLIQELEQRLLVVFTGQVRLAHQVLLKVVTRYLRRDNILISSIKRLAELAKIGREALMNGEIDELGSIMLEAWRLHQELDPFCSNKFVDELFAFADPYCCGYKLVGAGGGGFALMLAKNLSCAKELRQALEKSSTFDVKVYDWNIAMPRRGA